MCVILRWGCSEKGCVCVCVSVCERECLIDLCFTELCEVCTYDERDLTGVRFLNVCNVCENDERDLIGFCLMCV